MDKITWNGVTIPVVDDFDELIDTLKDTDSFIGYIRITDFGLAKALLEAGVVGKTARGYYYRGAEYDKFVEFYEKEVEMEEESPQEAKDLAELLKLMAKLKEMFNSEEFLGWYAMRELEKLAVLEFGFASRFLEATSDLLYLYNEIGEQIHASKH